MAEITPHALRRVGVVLFDGVEDLDFVGPLEVWGMASRLVNGALEVTTVAASHEPITTSFGLVVTPGFAFADVPPLDILVVPGGSGAWANLENAELLAWLQRTAASSEITSSVCSGAVLLAAAGVLRQQPATTHWNAMSRMRERYPDVELREGVRWVDEGGVVTSAGVSAGIEMSLHLVERLFGVETGLLTARWLEYQHWETVRLTAR